MQYRNIQVTVAVLSSPELLAESLAGLNGSLPT